MPPLPFVLISYFMFCMCWKGRGSDGVCDLSSDPYFLGVKYWEIPPYPLFLFRISFFVCFGGSVLRPLHSYFILNRLSWGVLGKSWGGLGESWGGLGSAWVQRPAATTPQAPKKTPSWRPSCPKFDLRKIMTNRSGGSPKSDHSFESMSGRVLLKFGPNWGPTWPPIPSHPNRSKCASKCWQHLSLIFTRSVDVVWPILLRRWKADGAKNIGKPEVFSCFC